MCLTASSASVAVRRRAMDPVYTVKIFPVVRRIFIWILKK
jgi:hypothetical protein